MTSTAPAVSDIARVVRPLLPAGYQAVLFGSRASGCAGAASDWDIGVLGPTPAEGALLERLREALESLPTLHSFDVVDLRTVPDGFREVALRTAVPLE